MKPMLDDRPRVKCVVCLCKVPEDRVVAAYTSPVCEVCDAEMEVRDRELYEADMRECHDRLWDRVKDSI